MSHVIKACLSDSKSTFERYLCSKVYKIMHLKSQDCRTVPPGLDFTGPTLKVMGIWPMVQRKFL